MMSLREAHSRINARIWQAIGQADLDLSALPKSDLEALVNLAADAALLEIDDEIGEKLAADKSLAAQYLPQSDDDEQLLWEGRPFLSVTMHYVITDQRLRIFDGLFAKEREDIELIRVQDIDMKQTLRERVLSVGDITVHSHDSSHPVVVLNNVKDPQDVHEILRKAVNRARKKHNLTFQDEM